MLDLGFDEEVGEIMNHFHHQRQTILYSATFPKKFQDFAKQTLVKPVVVNVGRAGAANLDVIQEVEDTVFLRADVEPDTRIVVSDLTVMTDGMEISLAGEGASR